MKKIAIIGFGSHVSKNILPAISRSSEIDVVAIYVRDVNKYTKKAGELGCTVKHISEKISSDIDWVYISTPISTHYKLIEKYLLAGKNVICEKPITDDSKKTEALYDLSNKGGLKLFEVCMYKYHKQYHHIENLVSDNSNPVKKIHVSFTIPHLSKDDIRYKKFLSGGALLDVGYYPVSLLFMLLGEPSEVELVKLSESGYEVDLSGVAIFKYDHMYCIAEWAIGAPYTNEVKVFTEDAIITYDRFFSKPETYPTKANVKHGFKVSDVEIGEDDQFVNMFEKIVFNDQVGYEKESNLTIALNNFLINLYQK